MRLLSLDPALRNTGYAVLQQDHAGVQAIDFGTIRNAPALSMTSCLVAIHRAVEALIDRHKPEFCAVESVIFVQNSKTAITLGAARGSALLAAAQRGLTIYEYPPKRVKQAVVGRGDAQKGQVSFMVRALLGLDRTPDADAADALAVGLTHLQMQTTPAALVGVSRTL